DRCTQLSDDIFAKIFSLLPSGQLVSLSVEKCDFRLSAISSLVKTSKTSLQNLTLNCIYFLLPLFVLSYYYLFYFIPISLSLFSFNLISFTIVINFYLLNNQIIQAVSVNL